MTEKDAPPFDGSLKRYRARARPAGWRTAAIATLAVLFIVLLGIHVAVAVLAPFPSSGSRVFESIMWVLLGATGVAILALTVWTSIAREGPASPDGPWQNPYASPRRTHGVETQPVSVSVGGPPPTADSPAEPGGFEGRVLAALDGLETGRSGWGHQITVLVISIIAFVALGLIDSGIVDVALIVGVIFIHELGHAAAMRLMGYHDVQMFFIPLLGAAVSAKDWAPEGWKRLVVSLAGPLPGIGLGVAMLAAFAAVGHPLMGKVALMLLLINGFNLLPFYPMDGGRVVFDVVFCRNRYMEAVFRACAAVMLAVVGFLLGAWLLGGLGVLMLLWVGYAWRIASIAHELKAAGVAPGAKPPARVPPQVAMLIIPEVLRVFAGMPREPKHVAIRVKAVWERLRATPPGALASALALVCHGGAFLVTLASLIVYGFLVYEPEGLGPGAEPPVQRRPAE